MNENLTINGTSIQVLKNWSSYFEKNLKIMKRININTKDASVFRELSDDEVKNFPLLDKNWSIVGKSILHIFSKILYCKITIDSAPIMSNITLDEVFPLLDKIRNLIEIAEMPEKQDEPPVA